MESKGLTHPEKGCGYSGHHLSLSVTRGWGSGKGRESSKSDQIASGNQSLAITSSKHEG